MGKGWSILFGLVFLGCLGSFIAAPFISGWWLPENIASFGGEVDYLFYVILGFTGFFFVLTELILVYTMWRYAYVPGAQGRIHPRQPSPGNDVDPGAGRHPAVYRVRPDQDLGDHQVLGHDARLRMPLRQRALCCPGHRQAMGVAHTSARRVSQARHLPRLGRVSRRATTCTWSTSCTLLEGAERQDLPENAGRHPQFLPAQPAAEAGRLARQDDSRCGSRLPEPT